jgi:Tfp pilus assembly protein PilZ
VSEELSALTLPELVGRLRDLHTQRTPLGWPTASAISKSSVERRIFELVAREPSREGYDEPADRIHCDVKVKVRSANRPSARSSEIDLRVGALFVRTAAPFTPGEPVEVEIETEADYRLRVRGNVGWVAHPRDGKPGGIGIAFHKVVGDGDERKLGRLIQELLRNRIET